MLDEGADPDATIETYRGETLCLFGNISEMAKLTIVEHDHGNPTFELRKFKSFPARVVELRRPSEGRAVPTYQPAQLAEI